MSGWIPVYERLPVIGQRVLIWDREYNYDIDWIAGETDADGAIAWKITGYDHDYNVTHWMPLPPPPGGE